MSKGLVVIISAPSGTGKSTICRRLLRRHQDYRCSISCTTRAPRPGEKNGKHYYFISESDFKRRIHSGDFLEWAIVLGHYYGTPRKFIENSSREGFSTLLAIDVQGAQSVRRKIPEAVLIFVAPPSMDSLRKRLAARHENAGSAHRRLAHSRSELAAAEKYDYLVVNDDLGRAVSQIESIITAESLRVKRRAVAELVAI